MKAETKDKMKTKGGAFASAACALMMTVALGGSLAVTPAHAATVTFNQDLAGKAVEGRILNAYKLATYTANTDGTHVYTFVSAEVKNAVVQVLSDMSVDMTGLTTDASIAGKIKDLNSSQQVEFASKIADKVVSFVTSTTIKGNAEDLNENSYYVVTETTTSVVQAAPFLLEVGTDAKTVTLKSSQPSIDKEITSDHRQDAKYDDTSIGSDVAFKLNGMTVPSTYGYDTFTYNITDRMSSGLTVTKDQLTNMKLTIGGNEISAGDKTYKVYVVENGAEKLVSELADGWSAKGAQFVIKFYDKYFIGTYGATAKDYTQDPAVNSAIAVTFSATLNSDATVATPETNTTHLTYSNTPSTTTDSTDHTVYVYTFGVEVQKSFSDNKNLFDRVEFGITGTTGDIYVTGSNGVYTVCKKGDTGAQDASKGLKLDNSGHFQIKGLDQGTYTVTETKIPDGYTSKGDKTITITPDYGNSGEKGKAGQTVTVANDADRDGYVDGAVTNTPNAFNLPQTGEVGMILLPALGLAIMGGVVVTSSRKRMKSDNQ